MFSGYRFFSNTNMIKKNIFVCRHLRPKKWSKQIKRNYGYTGDDSLVSFSLFLGCHCLSADTMTKKIFFCGLLKT